MSTTTLSIDDFCVVQKNTKDTEQFKEILDEVKIETSVILFVYGFPGTGKTTLLKKLGNLFPYHESTQSIRYHIPCNSNGQDLKSGFKDLVRRLKISDVELVINEIDKNKSGMLVEVLCNSGQDVLLVIEDVQPNSCQLFVDFLRNINEKYQYDCNYKFHVYVANRKKVFDEHGIEAIFKELTGFTQNEGIDYLMEGHCCTEENKKGAPTIVSRFSGSPLGLHAAKKFCEKCDLDYKQYINFCVEDIHTVTNEETEILKDTYGDNYQHIFHAITMPFVTEDNVLYWKVMSCIAYLNHTDIPQILITAICRILGGKKEIAKLEMNVGKFKSELKTYGLCEIKKVDDLVSYNFHEVVLHAFKCKPFADIGPLKTTIFAMSTIITKDLRNSTSLNHMKKLFRHLDSVLQHCEKRNNLKSADEFDSGWVLDELVLANLYEVTGSVVQSSSSVFEKECEKFLDLAIKKVWNVIKYLTRSNHCYDNGKNVKTIVELCQSAAEKLPKGFIAEYEANVISYQIKSQLDFLQSHYTQRNPSFEKTFLEFKQKLEKDCLLDVDKIEMLRQCELFLNEEDHRKIFFVERLALSHHSRSRIILYRDLNEGEDFEKCKVDSNLAYEMSKLCETNKCTLLSQFLSRSSGYFPLILKEEDTTALKDARRKCQQEIGWLRQNDLPVHMYEHGLVKEWKKGKNQIQLFRYLVNINRKLFNTLKSEPQFVADSKASCDVLLTLLQDNIDKNHSDIRKTFIVCARFYSLLGDHDKAIECFDEFFKIPKGTGRDNEDSWAILHFAEAVVYGKFQNRVNTAIDKCESINTQTNLNQKISNGLENVLKELRRMQITGDTN